MRWDKQEARLSAGVCSLALALGFMSISPATGVAQKTGEWLYHGSDAAHTRSTDADQIKPTNLDQLEVAWTWTESSLNPINARSGAIYVDGKLITTAGPKRTVVSIDPATGETLWMFQEPETFRWEYSMRANHGKGVAYAEVDGKGVVFITTPAFFLHALDAETGKPLENWGRPVPLEGFPQSGTADLVEDLIADWPPWLEAKEKENLTYDANQGIPLKLGYITSSSPPIVVNGVVVVGNSAEQGYYQSRIENVPGDILGYDARTGEFLWRFHVLPRPGEFGHDTWTESDAWKWTGDISSWAPMSADPELGLVYIPTNGATMDYYGGFRPGDNLFSTSLIALDVKTGERAWHYQLVHHDIWNYDTPTAPVLLDVTVDGEEVPLVVQATKQAFAYVFNRKTGEPIWPIIEWPVPQSLIPGEKLSPTQPYPTKPLAYDQQGMAIEDLIDFTPELRAAAIEALKDYAIGPLFNPPLHTDNDIGKRGAIWVPGDVGGVNITGPAVADPTTGIVYITSLKGGSSRLMASGELKDASARKAPTGTTIVDFATSRSGGGRSVQGLPIFKPPYSRITAIDLNTGDHLWWIPIGDTPTRIKNNPALAGIDIGNTGTGSHAAMLVTPSMLLYTANGEGTGAAGGAAQGGAQRGARGRGRGRGGAGAGAGGGADGDVPYLFAVDKATGERLAKVRTPVRGSYGLVSYMHEGRQYVLLQTSGRVIAMALPQ